MILLLEDDVTGVGFEVSKVCSLCFLVCIKGEPVLLTTEPKPALLYNQFNLIFFALR